MKASRLSLMLLCILMLCCAVVRPRETAESHPQISKKPQKDIHFRKKREATPGSGTGGVSGDLQNQIIQKLMKEILEGNVKEDIKKSFENSIEKFRKDNEKKQTDLEKKIKEMVSGMATKNSQNIKGASTIDIIPDKGMVMGNMFSPPGVKIKTSYTPKVTKHESQSQSAFSYNKGLGNILMNGCYGVNVDIKDPCYAAKRMLPKCQKMLESANFLGVGFDGRGDYSSSSRKKSIIQRFCTRGGQYDGFAIPDSMTVHGVYDTQVKTMTYDGIEQYRSYLEEKAAVSSSRGMFTEAVSKAAGHISVGFLGLFGYGGGFGTHSSNYYGGSSSASSSYASGYQGSSFRQMYISSLEVDVIRYEMFLDDVTHNDLNMDFLHDFLMLPKSYFASGAPRKFQSFILRWGTHYIKSAKFGGQLKLLKTKEGTSGMSITKFASQAQNDYEAMFSTYTAKTFQLQSGGLFHSAKLKVGSSDSSSGGAAGRSAASTSQGNEAIEQNMYSNEVLMVEGGEQGIAALISEMYTTGFKHELQEWLSSIPDYPKPFEFQMESIGELCKTINYKQLFPVGVVDFGCFASRNIRTEKTTGRRYYVWEYEGSGAENVTVSKYEKRYCDYANQNELEEAMFKRCRSLQRAISVYLEEGPIPSSDIHLPPGSPGCETNGMAFEDKRAELSKPSWGTMTNGKPIKIITDMPVNVLGVAKAEQRLFVFYRKANQKWYVKSASGTTHLYDGWNNGGSGNLYNRKLSIRGLVMTYNEKTGLLNVKHEDFIQSKKVGKLKNLPAVFDGLTVARAETVNPLDIIQKHRKDFEVGTVPCNVVWSNAHRFDPGAPGGKCISFAAMSKGDIFVLFAVIPKDKTSWYYVQISPDGVAIYKGQRVVKYVSDRGARSLGASHLYETYFICLEERWNRTALSNTTITFGKLQTDTEVGHVFAVLEDDVNPLPVRFFAFGNGEDELSINDAHVMKISATGEHRCQGGTIKFHGKCIEDCHPECKGCYRPNHDDSCRACRHLKLGSRCVESCPDKFKLDSANKSCIPAFPRDCLCILQSGQKQSGIYTIRFNTKTVKVYCDQDTDGGGWTVFQRRQDGSQNFYLGWKNYTNGFGNLNGEFWLGNEKLHAITAQISMTYSLRVDLVDRNGKKWYATYSIFYIGPSSGNYKLMVAKHNGTAGDWIMYQNGMQFSTKDRDNDMDSSRDCANVHAGGWWYNACYNVDLNSVYHKGGTRPPGAKGDIVWASLPSYLKFTEMKMRPTHCPADI